MAQPLNPKPSKPLNPKTINLNILNRKSWEEGDDLLRALGSASYDVTYETAAGRGLRFVMDSIRGSGRKEMLTDEQASSWKKAMNSIQQNGRKEMLTDEQASSWKKPMSSVQQNGRKEMLTDEQASSWKKAIGFRD